MKTFTKFGHNLLNALAFTNVGNMHEFHQLLAQSPAVETNVTRRSDSVRPAVTSGQQDMDLPDSAGAAAKLF
jgi:hypothetical protein